MVKAALWVISLIAFLNLSGCSFNHNGLDRAEDEVKKFTDQGVPSIKGLKIKEIDLLSDPYNKDTGTISYSFTDKRGGMNKFGDGDHDVSILYGPYGGTEVAKITVSKKEIQTENAMDIKMVHGLIMEYKVIKDHIVIFASSGGKYYTYEAKITDDYNEQQHFGQFYKAISEIKDK